jgi:type VI secretion system secreted protein VgrG
MQRTTSIFQRGGWLAIAPLLALLCGLSPALAGPILGSDLATYAVLATTQVTNAGVGVLGDTVIIGNMGAVSCTGFVAATGCTLGPGTVIGTTNLSNAAWSNAISEFGTAYTTLAGTSGASNLTGGTLGVGTDASLGPGVYSFSSLAGLTGTLTLAGGSNPNPVWIFQIGTAFTTDPGSSVVVTDNTIAGLAAAGVYFEVGSTATLGVNTTFEGNILAGAEVVFDTGAQITCGRAFAYTTSPGEVTFAGQNPTTSKQNEVSTGCADTESTGLENSGGLNEASLGGSGGSNVPEPSTLLLFGAGLAGFLAFRKRPSTGPA